VVRIVFGSKKVKDPFCKMEVDPKKTEFRILYYNNMFSSCSIMGKTEFERCCK